MLLSERELTKPSFLNTMQKVIILIFFFIIYNSLFSVEITQIKIPEAELKQNYFVNAKGDIAGTQNGGYSAFFWNNDCGYVKIPIIQEVRSLGPISDLSAFHASIISLTDKGTVLMRISYSRKKHPSTKYYILAGWSIKEGFKVLDTQSSINLVNYKYIGNDFIQLDLTTKTILYKITD